MVSFIVNEKQIFEVFEPQFIYEVPDYQREYSWTDKEIKQFMKDIFHLYDDNSIKKYFLGAMVLISPKEDNTKYLVIDGQQRITTLLIFLNVLKEKFNEIGETEEAERIQKPYLQTNEGKFRLRLNKNNRDFFDLFIQSTKCEEYREYVDKNKNDSNKLIINAYNSISKEIEKKFKEINTDSIDRKIFYKRLKEIIIKTNSLIQIRAGDESIAGLVFETLNTRGKSLETYEIIKNHIFWSSKNNENEKEIKILWNEMIRDNYKNFQTNFFHSYLTNYGLVSEEKLFDDFKDKIKEKDYFEFTLGLKKDVEILNKLKNPKGEDWDEEDFSNLQIIRKVFNVDQVYFILLAAYKKSFGFKKTLKILVRMVFINKFSQNLPFVFRKEASNICKKILDNKYKGPDQIVPELKRISPNLETIRRNFFEDDKNKTLKKKILLLINGKDLSLDLKKVTLEHIYSEESSEKFKQKAKLCGENLGYNYQINQIHNLTILMNSKENKQLGTKDFEEKVVVYGNEKNRIFPTNRKLYELYENHRDFNAKIIREYQDFIWDSITKVFNLSK